MEFLLSSNFDMPLGLTIDFIKSGSATMLCRRCEDVVFRVSVLLATGVLGPSFWVVWVVEVLEAGLELATSSPRATQSSVKLRQTLSALRRSWRSVTVAPVPIVLAPLEMGPS
jgi:hypothetical protein